MAEAQLDAEMESTQIFHSQHSFFISGAFLHSVLLSHHSLHTIISICLAYNYKHFLIHYKREPTVNLE